VLVRMSGGGCRGHHGRMEAAAWARCRVALPAAVYATGAGLQVVLSGRPGQGDSPAVLAAGLAVLAVPVVVGCLVGWRVPGGPVGAALAWVGAAPAAVFAVEMWGETYQTSSPWPAAHAVDVVTLGMWVWNLAGFVALCLVFPSGLLPGRRWRAVAWAALLTGVLVNIIASWMGAMSRSGRERLPAVADIGTTVFVFTAVLAVLVTAVLSLVVRYRRGDEQTRTQLRWLMLGAGTVPVLLSAGWLAQAWGASPGVAYTGFLVAMLVAVPAAVTLAVLRYDLFDVDRLLGSSLAWLLTTIFSAAIFAGVVYGAGELVGVGRGWGRAGAAFATALLLLPSYRYLSQLVGRVVDRERYVVDTRIQQFVRHVRDGTAEPETAEEVLRETLADPGLRLLIKLPGSGPEEYVGLNDNPVVPPAGDIQIPLRSGATEVGMIVFGRPPSARRLRRAREVALQVRLPIEVSRLRVELRAALRDVRTSRSRLVHAVAEERRQWERDLHDGAQQQVVAAGMRVRSLQRRLPAGAVEYHELDAVVEALEATIAELRRLAHGIRPSRLDDGLPAALHALVVDGPIPVRLSVADLVGVPEVLATTVYFIVAEVYANALKHARAGTVTIAVEQRDGAVRVEVGDDGVGGAGIGPTSVRDRVASVGGTMSVSSPPGGGTRVEVLIPDADRRCR
jgi:signal transduction histidine kinase